MGLSLTSPLNQNAEDQNLGTTEAAPAAPPHGHQHHTSSTEPSSGHCHQPRYKAPRAAAPAIRTELQALKNRPEGRLSSVSSR